MKDSPTNRNYTTHRRPVLPVVSASEDIPEYYRTFPYEASPEELEEDARIDRFERVGSRVCFAVLFFGSFYLGAHLLWWAYNGFALVGGR